MNHAEHHWGNSNYTPVCHGNTPRGPASLCYIHMHTSYR
jgi:hypothetical protein